MLELTLSVREVVAEPVVSVGDPPIASLFKRMRPLASRQWVAAETARSDAAGPDAAGGDVVWAPAANVVAVRRRVATRSFGMSLFSFAMFRLDGLQPSGSNTSRDFHTLWSEIGAALARDIGASPDCTLCSLSSN